jgi:hypothetical protein
LVPQHADVDEHSFEVNSHRQASSL